MAEHTRQRDTTEASTGELIAHLTEDVRTLIRDEIRLAQVELKDKGKMAGFGAGLIGGAALVAYLGGAILAACVVLLLGLAMPYWAAALIVGLALMIAAGGLALAGRRQISQATPPLPEDAIAGARKDVDAITGGEVR
jgi:Flp pilus assembly protein TadB